MTSKTRMPRRRALKLGAAAAALPLVHIRTAGAAGKLKLALWDHWVPTGDAVMRKLVDEWALKNKVDVELDFLTGIGNKINITMAAEAQAKTGHDVYAFDQWTVHEFADSLDPVDDIMKSLMGQYGPTSHAAEYLGVADGHWMAVPVGWGSAPLAACGRISLLKQHAGVDVQKWYPAEQSTPDAAKD
jgi:ABC-type glycerol-3-phosphate transport system substrate-binding protein